MSLRAVLDVEVNDQQFRQHEAAFAKYKAALDKTKGSWEEVTKRIDGSRKSFDELVAASVVRQTNAKIIANAEEAASKQVNAQARSWHDMARSTKSVAGNIAEATRALLKWTALTGVFSGLLGAGGLFGIERLAVAAAGQRRSSMGLGVSPGQQRSFELNFSRIVDPSSFLSSVNTGLHSITSDEFRGLNAAGFSQRDLAGKNTAQVATELLPRLQAIVKSTDPRMLEERLRSMHLDRFIGTQDAQRLGNMSAAELAELIAKSKRDVGSLDLAPDQGKAWADFKDQLARAGMQIENVFIKGLTDLAGPLGKLSEAFTALVSSALGGETGKQWIEALASGIETLSKTIGTPEFKADVKAFADGIGKMASAIGTFVKWFTHDASKDKIPPGDLGPGIGPGSREPTTAEVEQANRRFWEWLKSITAGAGSGIAPMGFRGYSPGGGQTWDIGYHPGPIAQRPSRPALPVVYRPSIGPGSSVEGGGGSFLGALLRRGEGGYDSVNRGAAGGYRAGKEDLANKTVAEVMADQAAHRYNAAGAYQIIGSTLKAAVAKLGLSGNEKFNRATQDRIFEQFLLTTKRPEIGAYLNGTSNNAMAAARALAREWASVTDPDTGRSHYDRVGNNRSSISVMEILRALLRTREDMRKHQPGQPGQAPSAPSPGASAWNRPQRTQVASVVIHNNTGGNAYITASQLAV